MSASTLFNSYVASSAICGAIETGLLDAVAHDQKVDISDFAAGAELDGSVLRSMADVLIKHDIFAALDESVVTKGQAFDDVRLHQGYFLWLVRGYGEMLSRVGELASTAERRRAATMRDGRAIAEAGRDYGSKFVDGFAADLIGQLDFTVLADLGCGSANRIIGLAQTYPQRRFVGVEVNAAAVEVARGSVRAAGLQERVEIIHDDISELRDDARYGDVDAVISFFLGHDLWPRANCLKTLETIRARMPRTRNFLLGDTYRAVLCEATRPPIFTLGFELTHAVMRQEIPTAEQWTELFADSVWQLRRRQSLDIAFSDIFHLVPRTANNGTVADTNAR